MPSHQWTGAHEQWTVPLPYRPSTTKKFGSAVLVGAAVTGGIAATAGNASASVMPTTQTMDNDAKSTVAPNSTVKFGGTLSSGEDDPLANEPVHLQWRTGNGSWHDGGATETDDKGHASISAKVGTSSQWRLSYSGDAVHKAALSDSSVVYTKKPQPKQAAGDRVLSQAAKQRGKPYEYGANGPDSFDCSGLTQYVYKKVGIDLPRTSQAQSDAVDHVPHGQAKPGDLLFFSDGGSVYHTAIYAGNHRMWTAPQSGETVKLDDIYSENYTIGRAR